MKIRTGFVSNSSSSSFLIPHNILSDEQLEKIKAHKQFTQRYGSWRLYDDRGEEREDGRDSISVSIPSDDFEMQDFFEFFQFLESIGIKLSQLEWEGH